MHGLQPVFARRGAGVQHHIEAKILRKLPWRNGYNALCERCNAIFVHAHHGGRIFGQLFPIPAAVRRSAGLLALVDVLPGGMHGCFVISAARVGTRVDAVCEIGGQGPGIPIGFSIAIAILMRAAQRIGAELFIARPVRVKRGQKIRQRNALFLVHQRFYGH